MLEVAGAKREASMTHTAVTPSGARSAPRPRHFYTEPEWIEIRDVRVAYRRKGHGPPTLYLHGAGFTRMWMPFYEQLSQSVDLNGLVDTEFAHIPEVLEQEQGRVV
jgi:hypothetical protein